MLKPLIVWITTNWKIFKEMGIPDCLTCLLRETCMQVKKQQLELDMKQQTDSKLGKVYIKAVYYHPAYLTSPRASNVETPTQADRQTDKQVHKHPPMNTQEVTDSHTLKVT